MLRPQITVIKNNLIFLSALWQGQNYFWVLTPLSDELAVTRELGCYGWEGFQFKQVNGKDTLFWAELQMEKK